MFIGTETEFGIASPTQPDLSPIISSTHVVLANKEHSTSWDYAFESPLRDARGFDLRRYHSAPIIDPRAIGMANLVVENGARLYVDHAHPEYSSPECSNAYDALVYNLAGDMLMHESTQIVQKLSEQGISCVAGHQPCPPLKLYKNNVDGKGASYGAHENYLYPRTIPFDLLAQSLIPFFVARIIIIGAGRVGIGQRSEETGFQISQRADYMEQSISLETTLNRGIINTRDEPHADSDTWGRLHVICGDANMSHAANFFKLGSTDLIIRALQAGIDFSGMELVDPVAAMKIFSRDLDLQAQVECTNGSQVSALDILDHYRSCLNNYTELNEVDTDLLKLWDEVVELLKKDPLSTAHLLDWTAKLALMRGYISRGSSWSDPKIALIDLQYCDIDPTKGLYHKLVQAGRMRTLVSQEEIQYAMHNAPTDSRAWLRSLCVKNYRDSIYAMNWDSISLDYDEQHYATIRMDSPALGTINHNYTSGIPVAQFIESLSLPTHIYEKNVI